MRCRELTELQRQNSPLGDPARALKEMHKRRKAEAMAQRQETKRRNAQARQEQGLCAGTIGASAMCSISERAFPRGLHVKPHHCRTAARRACLALADAKALADAMGIALGELRFLAFNQRRSRRSTIISASRSPRRAAAND